VSGSTGTRPLSIAPDFATPVSRVPGTRSTTCPTSTASSTRSTRCTPLAESGIIGTAVGMAMNGMRPVVEMQFDAFAYPAFEQIVSHVAKLANRTRGRVRLPMVIRIPYGGGIGGVEHHCDSSEAYYAHTAGLTVVTPSNPQDAYSLLRAAIRNPDPVIFLEPKKLYWSKGPVDLDRTERIGAASAARPGTDLTIVTYGTMVGVALGAARVAEPRTGLAALRCGGRGIDAGKRMPRAARRPRAQRRRQTARRPVDAILQPHLVDRFATKAREQGDAVRRARDRVEIVEHRIPRHVLVDRLRDPVRGLDP